MTAEQIPTAPALLDAIRCDECGEPTRDPFRCPHGREQCPDCYETLECLACAREAVDE